MTIEGFFKFKVKNFTLNTTFSISCSKITAIIGESGSGKTTFLKCLSGLIIPESGFLKVNQTIFQNSSKNFFINTNKRSVGHVMQIPSLFKNLSVFENLILGLNGGIFNYIKLDTLIKELNIEKILNKPIDKLSGGEKQRLVIAQIMLIQPKLILLDESFSAQDVKTKARLILFFKNINIEYSIPIIYVSHNILDVESFSNDIFYIKHGNLIINNSNI